MEKLYAVPFDQALSLLLGTALKNILWGCWWWNPNSCGNKLVQNWDN